MIDKNTLHGINNLLDQEKFNKARKQIKVLINKSKDLTSLLELYGLLIDIGCESQSESDLLFAIEFLEKHEEIILQTITKSSHYFNLANAKHGLAKIYFSENKGVPVLEAVKSHLQPPIDLYWSALKNLRSSDDQLASQILINLSNSLVDSGRLIEACQFLDQVLKTNPSFPQALVSRGDLLNWISQVTNCSVSIALYYEAYISYNKAIETKTLPPTIQFKCHNGINEAMEAIKSHGFDLSNIEIDKTETHREFLDHTELRQHAIQNFLTLNEHAIYCNCISTETDDLRIGVSHGRFKGQIVPKMELLLNRMKSEFGLARWLFFNRLSQEELNFDTKYSDLLEGEIIDSSTELLRTSFRVCYGILDKIALGICKLYEVTKEGENILFESFWKSKSERWNKLNEVRNPHLSALYSIACNLSTRGGELKEFKEWRNKLEHKVLILRNTENIDNDILKVYEDRDFVAVVDYSGFEQKTMHLMQLTRAAIFSFVYCVRLQTIEKPTGVELGFPIGFKE